MPYSAAIASPSPLYKYHTQERPRAAYGERGRGNPSKDVSVTAVTAETVGAPAAGRRWASSPVVGGARRGYQGAVEEDAGMARPRVSRWGCESLRGRGACLTPMKVRGGEGRGYGCTGAVVRRLVQVAMEPKSPRPRNDEHMDSFYFVFLTHYDVTQGNTFVMEIFARSYIFCVCGLA